MPKLPRVSGARAIRAMERMGFVQVRQKGSHVVLKRSIGASTTGCVIPMHSELATGTLRAILKLAEVTVEEFIKNL